MSLEPAKKERARSRVRSHEAGRLPRRSIQELNLVRVEDRERLIRFNGAGFNGRYGAIWPANLKTYMASTLSKSDMDPSRVHGRVHTPAGLHPLRSSGAVIVDGHETSPDSVSVDLHSVSDQLDLEPRIRRADLISEKEIRAPAPRVSSSSEQIEIAV